MPIDFTSGEQIEGVFTDLTDPGHGWQLIRSSKKNRGFKISGIACSGIFSNLLVGKAITLEINLIITFNPMSEYQSSNDLYYEAIEAMYKGEIFLYSLGTNWIFSTNNGRYLLQHLFNVELIETLTNHRGPYGNRLHYELGVPLISLVNRLSNVMILNYCRKYTMIQEVMILDINIQESDLYCLDLDRIDTIIAFVIVPELLEISIEYNLNLIWVDRISFLDLICREFSYQLDKQVLNSIHYIEVPKTKKINGLDGI